MRTSTGLTIYHYDEVVLFNHDAASVRCSAVNSAGSVVDEPIAFRIRAAVLERLFRP